MDRPRILLIGQCTLHWGRMEFGNIGNYYVAEPLFAGIRTAFPDADIRTTFQMSDSFVERFQITTLPANLYYGWEQDNLDIALAEFGAARLERETGATTWSTEYMDEVREADLVIDYSGDIWGDNADSLASDRFLVGALKDLTAQTLGTPTAMVAGSPGPFEKVEHLAIAKLAYSGFDLVTHREPRSSQLVERYGLRARQEESLACPAFLFKAAEEGNERLEELRREFPSRPIIGVAVSGWNITPGPFDRWPRSREEYDVLTKSITYLSEEMDAVVLLFSHSNGFTPPPAQFELIAGRDSAIILQIYDILLETPVGKNIRVVRDPLLPEIMKSLISGLDMLITGRVHAAVAALSSRVPTVMLSYAIPPDAHKVQGFADLAHMSDYVADATSSHDIIDTVDRCWRHREEVQQQLAKRIPEVSAMASRNFDLLKQLLSDPR